MLNLDSWNGEGQPNGTLNNGFISTTARMFTYNSVNLALSSEAHPETGTTQYFYTGLNGTADLLDHKIDAKGQVTQQYA